MEKQQLAQLIREGRAVLGIELGSTRIKAVLTDGGHTPVATGSFAWENRLENGLWTYAMEDVWRGLQACYREVAAQVEAACGEPIRTLAAIGFSGMMHGYLACDRAGELLVPFRTWRNTVTGEAARELTALFDFPIPQRWSIAHLYQAVLAGEPHLPRLALLTTLAGYVHARLTGERVLGVGEASGVFPVDGDAMDYREDLVRLFDEKIADRGFPWTLRDVLPRVLPAGAPAGTLTPQGAALLDPSGRLEAGVPLCPPEGDAGTGMVATNSVAARTGNVSAGTSIFAMVVLEKALSRAYEEIDIVATPSGRPVAMVHGNNGTSELDAWVGLFRELIAASGGQPDLSALYGALYAAALEGEPDGGGLLAYNNVSGEPILGLEEGRPLFARLPDSRLTLANFMRAQLFAIMGALRLGMDILTDKEQVRLDCLMGHGGLFKTPVVGQRLMAAALGVPVAVMETAGEGGAWGIALLAAYMRHKAPGETLEAYLENRVFAGEKGVRVEPDAGDQAGFAAYLERYRAGLAIERAAVQALA